MFTIITAFRNSKFINRCIESVINQTCKDWQMILIDDNSTNKLDYIRDSRITYIYNDERKYALRNIVESVWRYAGQEDIVVMLDGDDYLAHNDVLQLIHDEYSLTNCDALWTQHINSDGSIGNSGNMVGDPITCSWRMSHLRTFKKYLIHGVKPDIFLDENKEWWRCCYDQALYRPILKVAKKPTFFDKVCMVYNLGQGDNVKQIQIETAKKIQRQLVAEYATFKRKNICLIVNGKSDGCDKRFHQGERRQPLGVLTLAATLKARGHHVKLFDRFARPEYWHQPTIEWADVIGVSCTTPNFADAKKCLIELQKYRGEKLIIAGGAHCILHPEDVKPYVDLVSVSEADFEIIDMVEKGTVSDKQIRIENLDSVPLPDYEEHFNPTWNYTDTWDYDSTKGIVSMNTSRSCPHACTFCDVKKIWGRKWVARSAERVFQDVKYLTEKYNINGIYFREDNFCCSKSRLEKICNMLIEYNIKVKWACEMRADSAQEPELLQLMSKAGCVGIYVGAESGSNKMLDKIYSKGITREQIITACKNANLAGINVLMSIIEKHPEETKKDIEATAEMIKICNPKRVNRCDYRDE